MRRPLFSSLITSKHFESFFQLFSALKLIELNYLRRSELFVKNDKNAYCDIKT